jgi:hypothetical protein
MLNMTMNAAGARKPFDMSVGAYLSVVSETHDRHVVDWTADLFGFRLGFETSLAIPLVLTAVAVSLVLRRTRAEDQAV